MAGDLPVLESLRLDRRGRRLTITLDRPAVLNAFDRAMHEGLVKAFRFAAADPGSDVVCLTGAGRAFSAGGDLDRMEQFIADPAAFGGEVETAKRLITALLDIDKPVVARVNGPAVGLGCTLALFCDVVFAADTAKLGDPHVRVGLAAGDGGAVIWPQLIGFARAKEYLMTGRLMTAAEAASLGLVNHAVPADDLDARIDAFCDELIGGAQEAIRYTKATVNLELKRIAQALLDPGLAYEWRTVASDDHRRAVRALRAKDGTR
ncbi:enoyl-CoA hydratase/isomerase family protein [Rhodobacterales bacterium HKCCE2091]|nr:enoyl-CoA hydratase/isomerase family protein [Rhodobacterales bacterium HKCCE2091]